jgi:hypothetical protein
LAADGRLVCARRRGDASVVDDCDGHLHRLVADCDLAAIEIGMLRRELTSGRVFCRSRFGSSQRSVCCGRT